MLQENACHYKLNCLVFKCALGSLQRRDLDKKGTYIRRSGFVGFFSRLGFFLGFISAKMCTNVSDLKYQNLTFHT